MTRLHSDSVYSLYKTSTDCCGSRITDLIPPWKRSHGRELGKDLTWPCADAGPLIFWKLQLEKRTVHYSPAMAFLSSALTLSTPALLSILVGLLLFWFARNRYKPGLRSIPGPFLASISDLWYFVHCCRRRHTREWEIHQRYRSTLVRVGPNMVSCSDPEDMRVIYGLKRLFPKVGKRIGLSFGIQDLIHCCVEHTL